MNQFSLPADDSPPATITQLDQLLRRQLEAAVSKYFYESCDGVTQSLLISCEWYLTITATALTLVINSPNQVVNWRVLNHIVPIGGYLESFASTARIRVCPPEDVGTPVEIRVDELDIYQDSP